MEGGGELKKTAPLWNNCKFHSPTRGASCRWAKGCRLLPGSFSRKTSHPSQGSDFPSHVCLYNGGRLKNKQNHVYWDSHPGPKLRIQNCPHHGSLGYMDGPGRGKGESPGGKELAEWFPHKRPLPPKPQRNGLIDFYLNLNTESLVLMRG